MTARGYRFPTVSADCRQPREQPRAPRRAPWRRAKTSGATTRSEEEKKKGRQRRRRRKRLRMRGAADRRYKVDGLQRRGFAPRLGLRRPALVDWANAPPVGPISRFSENTTPLPLFRSLLRSVLSAPLVGGGVDATGALGTSPSTGGCGSIAAPSTATWRRAPPRGSAGTSPPRPSSRSRSDHPPPVRRRRRGGRSRGALGVFGFVFGFVFVCVFLGTRPSSAPPSPRLFSAPPPPG